MSEMSRETARRLLQAKCSELEQQVSDRLNVTQSDEGLALTYLIADVALMMGLMAGLLEEVAS